MRRLVGDWTTKMASSSSITHPLINIPYQTHAFNFMGFSRSDLRPALRCRNWASPQRLTLLLGVIRGFSVEVGLFARRIRAAVDGSVVRARFLGLGFAGAMSLVRYGMHSGRECDGGRCTNFVIWTCSFCLGSAH